MHSTDRVKGPQEHTACQAVSLATDVHAEVHPIDGIQISVSSRPKEHKISGCRTAMGMRSRIRLIIVRSQISLDFDNPSCQHAVLVLMYEQFPEKARRHFFWGIFKKRSRKQSTRQILAFWQFGRYLCDFFHSFNRVRTSSACPSGVTLGKICSSVWSGPIRNVVRSMPHTFLPYMFFSFKTPN